MPPAGTKTTLAKARLSQANAPREQPVSGLAYEKLLEFILSGELAPGTVLNERRLALELEISRTPVREAISRLAAEGLITSLDNRSPTVARIGGPTISSTSYTAPLQPRPCASRGRGVSGP